MDAGDCDCITDSNELKRDVSVDVYNNTRHAEMFLFFNQIIHITDECALFISISIILLLICFTIESSRSHGNGSLMHNIDHRTLRRDLALDNVTLAYANIGDAY